MHFGTCLVLEGGGAVEFLKGAHQGGHATARFLEGFLEGSLKEVLLRRVLRRRLVRVSIETEVLRRVLRRGGCYRRRSEGAWKAETRPFAEYDPLRVHPILKGEFICVFWETDFYPMLVLGGIAFAL